MQIILFDTEDRITLYPFTLIRPVADIRIGIFSARERWELFLKQNTYTLTENYLQAKFPLATTEDILYIDSKLVPSATLKEEIRNLQPEMGLIKKGRILAIRSHQQYQFGFTIKNCSEIQFKEWTEKIQQLDYPFQITKWNKDLIKEDFSEISSTGTTQSISVTNNVISAENIFIEEGAVVECCYLNASSGPIYIGKNCLIMEGAMIRGPFAMLDEAVVKMGSKIYGATSIGKKCTIGGEIKNAVFFDNSNKAHDGYIGDAVIGEWCNVGAGASCSNIKNTAGEIKIWNQLLHQWISAGNKCGVMLGDYTKVSINSSLTTGMVSGICCNIITEGLSSKFIADFSWNIKTGEKYNFEKAIRDIENWMSLKNMEVSENDQNILKYLYNQLT
jgi:UDP-N-acetylglucosamine diphosphorylase/glucosamine-1-phosphate N-acetyltransferase